MLHYSFLALAMTRGPWYMPPPPPPPPPPPGCNVACRMGRLSRLLLSPAAPAHLRLGACFRSLSSSWACTGFSWCHISRGCRTRSCSKRGCRSAAWAWQEAAACKNAWCLAKPGGGGRRCRPGWGPALEFSGGGEGQSVWRNRLACSSSSSNSIVEGAWCSCLMRGRRAAGVRAPPTCQHQTLQQWLGHGCLLRCQVRQHGVAQQRTTQCQASLGDQQLLAKQQQGVGRQLLHGCPDCLGQGAARQRAPQRSLQLPPLSLCDVQAVRQSSQYPDSFQRCRLVGGSAAGGRRRAGRQAVCRGGGIWRPLCGSSAACTAHRRQVMAQQHAMQAIGGGCGHRTATLHRRPGGRLAERRPSFPRPRHHSRLPGRPAAASFPGCPPSLLHGRASAASSGSACNGVPSVRAAWSSHAKQLGPRTGGSQSGRLVLGSLQRATHQPCRGQQTRPRASKVQRKPPRRISPWLGRLRGRCGCRALCAVQQHAGMRLHCWRPGPPIMLRQQLRHLHGQLPKLWT